ncbi:unnamed protein product [Rhizophagus irregularis]|nr:unnamed protein product [Rhizophagus irregularis]
MIHGQICGFLDISERDFEDIELRVYGFSGSEDGSLFLFVLPLFPFSFSLPLLLSPSLSVVFPFPFRSPLSFRSPVSQMDRPFLIVLRSEMVSGFRVLKNEKPRFVSGSSWFRRTEKNQDSFRAVPGSKEWKKTKIRSAVRVSSEERKNQVSFGWASEEWKTQRFVRVVPKNRNSKGSVSILLALGLGYADMVSILSALRLGYADMKRSN